MKYLDKAFEADFTEIKNNKKKKSGLKFEKLVLSLLNVHFPKLSWSDTPVTHDGSKDFYAQEDNYTYWAECKNYSKVISLQTISPTLIMAELCNVDEIYFFSYSSINDNVKRKLCYYSYINHKKIRFYDNIALEQLIFHYGKVYNKYFSKYKFSEVNFNNEAVPQILFNCIRNPFLNTRKEEILFGSTDTLLKCKVNEIISLQVCIINRNLNKKAQISIEIDKNSKDLLSFELLDKNKKRNEITHYTYNANINPNEIFFHNIDLKIIEYKSDLNLPNLNIEVNQDEFKENRSFPWSNLECSPIHKAEFIGSSYHGILTYIEDKLLDKTILSGILIEGSSGTGKSRILEESLSLLIKYDYKVLNFIGIENDSGKNIIKEIIYVLFEISEDLITQSFTVNSTINSPVNLAYKMLCDINQKDMDIISIINKYGEIIFERLMASHYALVVDNIQYFDNAFIHFIEKLISYAKNNNRCNFLFLAFSLNTDFVSEDMKVKKIQNIFHFLEKSSVCNIKTFPVNGFQKKGSALEFIKQLLDVKNDYYDISLMKVVERASLKPYYIESIIEILNHFKSVKYGEEGFEIEKPTLFQTELDELPENAEDNLAIRWCFFLKQFQNENDYINLLSIIHVFGMCDINLVRQLKLNEKSLHHLCTYNFLKSEYVSNCESFAFIHDLMEQFFCKYIARFDSYAYKYLRSFNKLMLKRSFPIVYNLCILYENKYNPVSLEEIIYSGSKLNIPYKIFRSYYQNCLIALLNQYELFENKSRWYILCLYSGTQIKKRMGNEYALSFFDQLFSAFTENVFKERYNYSEFANLLFFYGEVKQQLAQFHDVIALYHSNLEQYEKNSINGNSEQIKEIIAFIYNRLSVAYKHMDGINNEKKKMEYINRSLYLSRQLDNKQFLAENCYDKGTYYYCHKKYKKKVLAYWTSCCNLIHKYKIEPMTLHYIEHRIQISLIKKDLSDIQELLQYGRDYLIHGKYNEQSIYFERFFSQAEAVYWLMKKEEYGKVRELLDQAEIANLLLGKNNLTYVNYLRGKLYYNLTDKTRCYQFYKKAYEGTKDLIILYKDDFIDMLIDDIAIKFRHLEISDNLKPIDFWRKDTHALRANRILNMSNMEFNQFLDNYQATSIIASLDGKENFPYI